MKRKTRGRHFSRYYFGHSSLRILYRMNRKRRHNRHRPQSHDKRNKVDRISNLPEHLLSNILSLISIKDAVRTSVLSSRWRHLWTLVTDLSFVLYMDDDDGGLERFEGMVDHVLSHCNSTSLDKFHLHCPEIKDFSRINSWISSAVSRKPKTLNLEMDFEMLDYEPFAFPPYPQCILNYNTMTILKLKSCFDVEIPDSILTFPCLKILHFTGLYPYHCDVLEKFLSGCPVLEVLHLKGLIGPNYSVTFWISFPTLKKLYLDMDAEEEGDFVHIIIIDAPRLEYLDIKNDGKIFYRVDDPVSITYVHVCFQAIVRSDEDHVPLLLLFLLNVSKAKHLSLSVETVMLMKTLVHFPWKYPNLTTLTMWVPELFDLTLLRCVLNSSPNLKHLSLHTDWSIRDRNSEDELCWNPPDQVPDCLKLNLEYIEYNSFKGRRDELQLVEYLLNNAQLLEVMLISAHPYPLEDEMVEKVESFCTASPNCEVHICEIVRRTLSSSDWEELFDS